MSTACVPATTETTPWNQFQILVSENMCVDVRAPVPIWFSHKRLDLKLVPDDVKAEDAALPHVSWQSITVAKLAADQRGHTVKW